MLFRSTNPDEKEKHPYSSPRRHPTPENYNTEPTSKSVKNTAKQDDIAQNAIVLAR